MPRRINLADPDFEPTDEELIELSERAFAHVAEESAEHLRQIHDNIQREGQRVLRELKARMG